MAASERNTTRRKGSLDILTTENGEIPEYLINGVSIAQFPGIGGTISVDASSNYVANGTEDIIYTLDDITVTLIDPSLAYKNVSVRSIVGTATVGTAAGTIETTSVTVDTGVRYGPRATGWFDLP